MITKCILAISEAQEISYSIPMSLPFPRNHNFTGRKDELLEIQKVFHGPEVDTLHRRIMVLCGLGGVGKSQLATEYAYDFKHMYTSVWWVNATTTASLSQDFLQIAQQLVSYHAQKRTSTGQTPDYSWIATILRLPADSINQAGQVVAPIDMKPIIQGIKSWLMNEDNGKWLMIVDNYDDLVNVKITDFLPHSSGSVIITSRAQDSRRLGSSFEVEVVNLEDGIEILRRSAGTKIEEFAKGLYSKLMNDSPLLLGIVIDFALPLTERNAAVGIVERLGALPLALDQAGSYINSIQIPYREYLPRFDGEFSRIASKRPPNSVWQYREDTVLTTWEISFTALGPGAQELLLLCGFFDNKDIWDGLLSTGRLQTELGMGIFYPPNNIERC